MEKENSAKNLEDFVNPAELIMYSVLLFFIYAGVAIMLDATYGGGSLFKMSQKIFEKSKRDSRISTLAADNQMIKDQKESVRQSKASYQRDVREEIRKNDQKRTDLKRAQRDFVNDSSMTMLHFRQKAKELQMDARNGIRNLNEKNRDSERNPALSQVK